jgi:hypothetical protein
MRSVNYYRGSIIFALNRAAIYNKVGRYKAGILHLINFMDKTQNVLNLLHSQFALTNISKDPINGRAG